MRRALVQAERAANAKEVPVGAVVVLNNEIIGTGHNQPLGTHDPTAHAELLALRDAASELGSWRLDGATLIVTLEPCPMCAGAATAARLARVVWGAPNRDAGALGSLYHFGTDPRLNHEFEVSQGVRAEECVRLLTNFFAKRR